MTRRMQTLFLMTEPSFWFGTARIGDLFGRFDQFNLSRTPAEADARALAGDWFIVGDDLVDAMDECRRRLERRGNDAPESAEQLTLFSD